MTFVFSVTRVPLPIRLKKLLFKKSVYSTDVELVDTIAIYQTLGTDIGGSIGVAQRAT